MTTYGLTKDGFVPKPLLTIKSELEAQLRNAFGASIDLSPESVFSKIVGIFAEREALLWELAQAVHSAFDPDLATGTGLDGVAAITGTVRKAATHSEVTATLTGAPTTLVEAGKRISVEGTGVQFETLADATISAVDAWQASTEYELGDRVTNNSNVYQCITAGESAGSGGPTTEEDDIIDNEAHWRFLGEGTGAVDVECQAVETGPKIAVSGTLNTIETPVSGWQSAINVLDATLGSDIETDAELRLRRVSELTAAGNATIDAIRTALLAVEGVEAVTVFQNVTMETDENGLPPKSVEALVLGGADQDVVDALFASVAGGIETYGTESGTATDASGETHTIRFSRPEELEVYIIVDVEKDPSEFPSDGEDQIKAALVAFGNSFPIGKDVTASALSARIFSVPGVLDVTLPLIGTAPAPATSATITVTNRQRAVFDTSRITVNLSDGTP